MWRSLALLLLVGCTSQLPGPVSRYETRDRYLAEWAAARWAELELPPLGECPLPRIVWPASDETVIEVCRQRVSECYDTVRPHQFSADRVPVIVVAAGYPREFWAHGLMHRFEHCSHATWGLHAEPRVWGTGVAPWTGGLLHELEAKTQE